MSARRWAQNQGNAWRSPRPAGLTGREIDVLRLLARGGSSRQIADELVISPKTARNHIEHISSNTSAPMM